MSWLSRCIRKRPMNQNNLYEKRPLNDICITNIYETRSRNDVYLYSYMNRELQMRRICMCEETYKWDLYIYLKKTYKSDMYIREKIINDVCIYITRTTNKTYSYMWDVHMRNIYTYEKKRTHQTCIYLKRWKGYTWYIYIHIYMKRELQMRHVYICKETCKSDSIFVWKLTYEYIYIYLYIYEIYKHICIYIYMKRDLYSWLYQLEQGKKNWNC